MHYLHFQLDTLSEKNTIMTPSQIDHRSPALRGKHFRKYSLDIGSRSVYLRYRNDPNHKKSLI